jgi:hypothetical protein
MKNNVKEIFIYVFSSENPTWSPDSNTAKMDLKSFKCR